jgi:hypothetical protein
MVGSRRKDIRRRSSKTESVGRPKMRWLDDVEEDLRKMRISAWRGKARKRDK